MPLARTPYNDHDNRLRREGREIDAMVMIREGKLLNSEPNLLKSDDADRPKTDVSSVRVDSVVSRQDRPSVELLGCPFCGGLAEFVYCEEGCCGAMPRAVACTKCGCELPEQNARETEGTMAMLWNVRA